MSNQAGADPCAMVIFGASGDLTCRKLAPALYNLALDGLLPDDFAVVGVARSRLSGEAFVESLAEGVRAHSRRPLDNERWNGLAKRISYVCSAGRSPGPERGLHSDRQRRFCLVRDHHIEEPVELPDPAAGGRAMATT